MARIVNFFDGAESETTPVIGNIVASGLVVYPDDASYEAAELGAPIAGNIYFNSTTELIRYYNGTNWITLVDENSTQTIENKSIDADDNNITNIDNDDIKVGAAIDAEKIHDGSVTNTEFGYLDGTVSNIQDQLNDKQETSEKGVANGYASLDGSGLVPASQLPSYVDDVLEFADLASFPVTGETGKIYIAIDSGNIYRWSGTIYVQISASGANQELSNLTSPTAINQHLIPDVDSTRDLGSLTIKYNQTFSDSVFFQDGRISRQNNNISINSPTITSSPETTGSLPLTVQTLNNSQANSAQVEPLYVLGGNKTAGTGNGGDVFIKSGTSVGGNAGSIKLKDGSEGTIGHIWTSKGVDGEGNWEAAPASGANTALSNLTSSTSINQSLLPSTNVLRDFGSPNLRWRDVYTRRLILGNSAGAANDDLLIGASQSNLTPAGNSAPNVIRTVNKSSQNQNLGIYTATLTTDNGEPSKNIYIETGNKQLGTQNSGEIVAQTGTSAGGDSGNIRLETGTAFANRGKIILKDGTEGSIGHVWTSTGINGEGNWEAAPSALFNKTQTKLLTADVTTNTTISDLTFNNLVIGTWYEIVLQASLVVESGADDRQVGINIQHNSTTIGRTELFSNTQNTTGGGTVYSTVAKFQATATTLTFESFSASANSYIEGNTSAQGTFAQITERNDLVSTTDFT